MTSPQPSWKTIAYRVFVAVFVLGMITSTMAIWANARLQNSDTWAETVDPLANDTAVQEFVVQQASLVIDQQIAADESAGRLESFGRAQLSGLASVALHEFVSLQTFANWWTEANRTAHGMIMRTLDSNQGLVLQTEGEDLVLDLTPAVDWVNNHITTLLPNAGYLVQIPPERAIVVLYSSESLNTLASVIDLVDTLAFVLPLISLIALAGALFLAPDRRMALTRIAHWLAASMVIILVLANIGRWLVVSGQPVSHQDVLDAIVRITLSDLLSAFRVMAIVGLLFAGAVALQHSQRARESRVMVFIHKNRKPIAASAVGIALAALLVSNYPPIWLSVLAPVTIICCAFQLYRWRNQSTEGVNLEHEPART